MSHPYFEGVEPPRVFAHRGLVTPAAAGEGIVENSLASLTAAETAGADYLESDGHLTSDGVVVLFHDSDLRRVTGDPRAVAEVTSAELAELMAGRGGLITLEAALERFASARFNLDVKAAAAAEAMGRLIAPHAHRVLLTSFSERNRHRALRAAAANGGLPATSPSRAGLVRLLFALASRSPSLESRALESVDALQIPERHRGVQVLSPRLIEAAHREGVEVHVWTVNDTERMRQLVAMGVDGIITDRADLALEALKS